MAQIKNIMKSFKSEGFKATLKSHGWKAIALILGYYLIRDTIVYLVLPGLMSLL